MDRKETYRQTLQYALAIAGSELVLSVRLKVTIGKLTNWLNGIEPIPDAAFLDAVDVIVEAGPADIARTRNSDHSARGSPR